MVGVVQFTVAWYHYVRTWMFETFISHMWICSSNSHFFGPIEHSQDYSQLLMLRLHGVFAP